MNERIKAGEVFKLVDLVPYAEGKVDKIDVAHNDKMKCILMAFPGGFEKRTLPFSE